MRYQALGELWYHKDTMVCDLNSLYIDIYLFFTEEKKEITEVERTRGEKKGRVGSPIQSSWWTFIEPRARFVFCFLSTRL